MRRLRGTLIALLIAAATIGVQAHRHPPPQRFDRFDLPAFDAHVYIAMAEHPAFFSVAPWGYRLLTPALVQALPVRSVARGFRIVTLGGLTLAGVLLYLYLRRLGANEAPSLIAVAAFCVSGPVAEALRYRFLVEPLTLALELAFLLALEAGAGAGVLGLLATLGAVSKEFFLLLLPLVFLRRWRREGAGRAVALTLAAALPALAVTLVLRLGWTPYLQVPWPRPGLETLALGLERIRESWPAWWPAAFIMGLTPAALLGALRKQAAPLRLPCGYLFLVALLTPFLNPVTFFPKDVPRLLLYGLPGVVPLALVALDRVWPHLVPPPPPLPAAPLREGLAAAAALVPIVLLPFALDPYRRVDLQGPRDGPLVLALCRETLRTAGRLERGQTVSFEAQEQRFAWGESDPGELGRMRWFLREGWGQRPHYGTEDMLMQAARGSLVVPTFGGADLELALALDAAAPARLLALLNGRPVGEVHAGPEPRTHALRLPATLLFRGDNELTLARQGATDAPPRLLALALRPVR